MRQEVVARVLIDMDNPTNLLVIVRKTIFNDSDLVEKKFGLSVDGSWVEVPEAAVYPSSCFLPVFVTRVNGDSFKKTALAIGKPQGAAPDEGMIINAAK